MGIAKTMIAYGEYDFYSFDFNQFIEKLAQLFCVNIHASFFEFGCVNGEEPEDIEDKYYNFDFPETYKLQIDIFSCIERKSFPGNKYCQYELTIPVQLEDENELILTFFPSGFFALDFLPFNSHWRFFVEEIMGIINGCYKSHEEIILEISKIRNCYIDILKKINCSEVIICTTAPFKAEDEYIYSDNFNKKYALSDMKKAMQNIDGISLIPFMDAVNHKLKINSKRNSYLDVAFIDKF